MSKLIFNPPPGWTVQEPGWLPGPSWQPPDDWPPIPAGWPLFYIQRTGLTTLVWLSCVVAASVGYGWLMSAVGSPLSDGSYGLVSICILAFLASGRMGAYRAAPLTKWTWLPNRPPVSPSAVAENPRRG